MCVCVCVGAGGDVCRAGGGGEQHSDGSYPGDVDEEVVPQPQAARELRQRLPGATQVLTGDVRNQMLKKHHKHDYFL